MSNIKREVEAATKWSIFTELIVKIISPITNMILARMLTPTAFGVVATVTMIVSFTDIFTDAGFQKYIIQHQFKNSEDEDVSICVAFWTNICISVFLWGMIYIFADKIAEIVGNPGLGNVIYIGSLVLPLTSFSSIQTAIYRKKLNYQTISIARIIVKIVPLVITVPLAKWGFSYWSLIIGNIFGELCNAVLLSCLSNWKPKLRYSLHKLKEMFKFCGWTLLETISSWLVTNVGIFIIGRVFNEYYLGVYKTATTMVSQITSLISGATISVLFSALSILQNDKNKFKEMYFSFLHGVGLFAIPLGVGIYLYRDIVRIILLGSQWKDADLLIGMWGFVLAESIIFNDMSGALTLAKGRPQLLFVVNMTQAVCMLSAIILTAKHGFTNMVIASSLVRFELPIIQTVMACVTSGIRFKDIILQLKNYIIATGIMLIVGIFINNISEIIWIRYISIIICIIVYFVVLYIIPSSKKELKTYIKEIKNKLK